MKPILALALLASLWTGSAAAADDHPLSSIPLRSIGPALTSGRVSDFAFHPEKPHVYYVAMASAGLWMTDNDGITWKPLFDEQASYALGVVEIDPHNPMTIWVGSGENNNQRSVGYGDGIYRSLDGGQSWTNMGLKDSGNISMIKVHPTDPNVIYAAAQGPLWSSGGDRGLYRSSDGGETWERVLNIDEHTGVNEFVIDPRNPDNIVASSYQRRRHVWTLINGGPGSGVHKSTDGGNTWRKLSKGLPGGEMGRIGLAGAPSAPSTIYAIIEADEESRGVYRSVDFGESWDKRSGHIATSPQYYNELVVDPLNADRVYSPDTFTNVSEDGGATFSRLSFQYRHVDDHALWIDPAATEHLIIGGDGGIFESYDRGQTWRHVTNLPTTQFYRATPDSDAPFYNVCAGTQDNHTQCGPSRTRYTDGITNADWWIAQFGDGFKAQFDPDDPNIVYAQYQYGGLVRFDRISGERTGITPRPGSGELNYNWNWNAPLIVSPHEPSRLYYGAERLFRSDDRGDSWVAVSDDLSRGLDRNALEVMGRVWSVDAIAKNHSTSVYGSLIALAESPLEEGLIYAGTDDGLIQVTADGGENWRTTGSFRGVPDQSLIEDVIASYHDADVVYAVIDNHKRGDLKPYVLRSDDRGASFSLITSGLPDRGSAHAIVEDDVDPNLLFVGTEFGAFFSQDAGQNWHPLKSLPTIAVRDLEIQRREHDLVVGTFGRGIYILDNIDTLRPTHGDLSAAEATLFAPRAAWIYVPDDRRGWGGLGDYGHRYSGENAPHGAVFEYYLSEGLTTLAKARRDAEKERAKSGEDNPYPSWHALRQEDQEEDPTVWLTVTDADGNVVRRISGPTGKGLQRVAWDMRYPAPDPVDLSPSGSSAPWATPPMGPLALPGNYSVSLAKRLRGEWTELAGPQPFTLKAMFEHGGEPASVLAFQQDAAELQRRISAIAGLHSELNDRLNHVLAAIPATTDATEAQAQRARAIRDTLLGIGTLLSGDRTVASRQERTPLALTSRIGDIMGNLSSRAAVTGTHRDSLAVAKEEYQDIRSRMAEAAQALADLETELESLGAPWTPGRMPQRP